MNLASLLIAHHVLLHGSVRETSRLLDRPVASVSAALSRLQSYLATPLTTLAGNRIVSTLEGRRLGRDLARSAELIVAMAALAGTPEAMSIERQAARLSISLLTLSRFIVVARTGSIRSAAIEIGMGQPQLTRQLKALETDLGVKLLERTATGAVPTAEGKTFLLLSEDLQRIWLRMSERADDRFRRAASTTNLGSVTPLGRESLVAKILARLAAEWSKRQPRSPLYISSNNAEELLAGLSSRQYDMVLLDTADIPAEIDHRILSRSGLSLVGPSDLIARSDKDLRHLLLTAPIALPSLKSGLRQKFALFIEDVLTAEDRALLSFVEIDSIPVIANLVVEHGYVALLPEWATSGLDEAMATLPLPRAYDMQLSLAWRKGDSSFNMAALVETILTDAGLMQVERRRA